MSDLQKERVVTRTHDDIVPKYQEFSKRRARRFFMNELEHALFALYEEYLKNRVVRRQAVDTARCQDAAKTLAADIAKMCSQLAAFHAALLKDAGLVSLSAEVIESAKSACSELPQGEQAQFFEDLSYDLGQLAAELRAAEHRAAR